MRTVLVRLRSFGTPSNRSVQTAGRYVSKEAVDMSAPKAQSNGADTGRLFRSCPQLTDITVRARSDLRHAPTNYVHPKGGGHRPSPHYSEDRRESWHDSRSSWDTVWPLSLVPGVHLLHSLSPCSLRQRPQSSPLPRKRTVRSGPLMGRRLWPRCRKRAVLRFLCRLWRFR